MSSGFSFGIDLKLPGLAFAAPSTLCPRPNMIGGGAGADNHHLSHLLNELCTLLFAVLRSPHLALPPSHATPQLMAPGPVSRSTRRAQPQQVTPVGFASLLLGASLALMLCGSVTFVIGFIMMPWVIGLVLLLYFLGILSSLSGIWRAVLCPKAASSASCCSSPMQMMPGKDKGSLLSKFPFF